MTGRIRRSCEQEFTFMPWQRSRRECRPWAGFVQFRTLWARGTAGLRPAWTARAAVPTQPWKAEGGCPYASMDRRGRLSLREGGRRTEPALSEVEGSARPTLRLALLPVTACYRGRCNSRCGLLVGRGCLVLLCVRG